MPDSHSHQKHWDKKYALGNTHADYKPDTDLVKLIHHFPDSGLALDLACGTGRNSFFIAQYGLDVVCMDFSIEGLKHLELQRSKFPLLKNIFPVQADLSTVTLAPHSYDALFVIRYLDRSAFASYFEALKPDGLLFIKAFNVNHLKRKKDFNPDYLLKPGELISQFANHEVLHTNDDKNIMDFESMILIKNS